MHVNYEFKAKREDTDELESLIQPFHPRFEGTDHQVDTYFNVPNGRLKLREGTIEHALIHYERNDAAEAKQSLVTLYHPKPDPALKQVLQKSLGIMVVVDKRRKIYFIDNVKFHFDEVEGLGRFVEVEAIDTYGTIGIQKLKEQCNVYAHLFRLTKDEYISGSYSDLLLAKKSSTR